MNHRGISLDTHALTIVKLFTLAEVQFLDAFCFWVDKSRNFRQFQYFQKFKNEKSLFCETYLMSLDFLIICEETWKSNLSLASTVVPPGRGTETLR